MAPEKRTAIIIGGSIAGLFAARILSEYYEEVIIAERDHFPDCPENRAGTPQAYHPHRLLERGKLIIDELFPGYAEELLLHGAYPRENKLVSLSNWHGRLEMPDENNTGCSRALFEWVIRRKVQNLSNVRFHSRLDAKGLLFCQEKNTVTGVQFRDRGGDRDTTIQMQAHLVVDTSGRTSKLPYWLQMLGHDIPKPEKLHVSLGYSTRHYKIPSHLRNKWSVILNEGDPSRKIGTAVFGPIENHKAEMVLYRAGGESYPATDGVLYQQEAKEMFGSAIGSLLQELEPLSEPRGYRVDVCIRQHYELMDQWPSGLLVLGDAFCNFDPIFGQGMTVAAIQAETLNACLSDYSKGQVPEIGFERSVLKRIQSAIEPAWWLSVGADLRWLGVKYEGPHSMKGFTFAQNLFDLCMKLAYTQNNFEVFGQYMGVTGLLSPPEDLFNSDTIEALAAMDESGEGRGWIDQCIEDEEKPLQQILEQIIPSFN